MTLYRALIAATVFGGAYLTYRLPNGPLLFWWLFSALALGCWVAFSRKQTGLGARAKRLVLLYCVLVSSGLISTQLAARRLTSATHVRFQGVLFERADSVAIASGETGIDVILPTLSPTQSAWHLAVERAGDGWRFSPGAAVEQVRVSPAAGSAPEGLQARLLRFATRATRTSVLNGVVLDDTGDRVVLRDEQGQALDTLTLDLGERGTTLRSTGGVYDLGPGNPRLRARYQRMLRFGTTLGSLDGSRSKALSFDRFVRVQRLGVHDEVNGNAADWRDWVASSGVLGRLFPAPPTRVLITAAAPFALDGGPDAPSASISFADSVRVEVRHLGGLWRFDLVAMRREATAERGLSVRFVRNPRPLDSPLPSGDSCTPGVACGLLSLRRLPMPVAHIALDGAGLDPSRFALLARLEDSGDGVRVVLPRDSMWLARRPESGAPVAIPVTDLRALGSRQPAASESRPAGQWVLMSASSNTVDDAGVLVLVCLGVTGLLLLIAQLVGASAGKHALVDTPRERFLVLGLNAILALLLARLIIGARVTFFAPYLPAGLDTAIGLWVAIAVVTIGLLSWPDWAPRILKLARALVLQRSLSFGTVHAAFRATFSGDEQPQNPRRLGRALLFMVALVLLGWVSLPAAGLGLICGLAVLSTWFTIAWTAAFSGSIFHSFENGPFEVIEYQGDHGPRAGQALQQLPEQDVLLLPPLWALAVWQPGVGVLAVLTLSVARLVVAARRVRASAAREAPEVAELMPVLLGQTVSTLAIAFLAAISENGALAAFVLVILVALVGVRAGRALASRLAASGPGAWKVPAWMMILYLVAPLLLLLPLAVIDMGLLLVMVIPVGAASLLAVGLHRLTRGWRLAAAGVGLALLFVLFTKVLFPDVEALASEDPQARAERFEEMQEVFGVRLPVVGASFERAAARAVAARDQRAAEELLIAARPGFARDLLVPSIEQAWASRAYAAAGALGVGLGAAPIGRGIAEAVSYAENSFAVYVLHEHGVFGGVAVLLAYFTFALAVMLVVRATPAPTESLRASRAMFLVAVLVVTIPAVYVALSNVGMVPITGQNMPFLGLNAWSDVTLCAGVVGILITGAIRTETGGRGRGALERSAAPEEALVQGVAS